MTVSHEDLGLYLLGKLDPSERLAFEQHLAACEPCRDELAELSGVRTLLDTVTAHDAVSELPPVPPAILPGLLAAAATDRARERRRRRLALAGGGGVLAAGGAAAAVVVLLSGGSPAPAPMPLPQARVIALHGSGATGHLELEPSTWGSNLTLTLDGLPRGEHCSLVLITPGGQREEVSTWTADYEGMAAVHATTDLTPAAAAQVRVEQVGSHKLLLSNS